MTTGEQILPRLAARAFQAVDRAMPVIIVTGARQTGKSTLVRTLPDTRDRPYLTLDDLDVQAQARTDPDDLVHRAPRERVRQRRPSRAVRIGTRPPQEHPIAPAPGGTIR